MYKVFASRLKSSTAFRVRPDPDKAGYYLVKHTRPPTDFPWLCHEFWVKAVVNEEIPEESEFNCECMRIEHTGMFLAEKCSLCFLVRCRKMFIRFTELLNLQVCFARIFCVCLQTCKWRISHPGISPKRYTRNAREATPFDRHDKVYVGPSGDTKASRMLELLPDWCALQQKSVMSSEVRNFFLMFGAVLLNY